MRAACFCTEVLTTKARLASGENGLIRSQEIFRLQIKLFHISQVHNLRKSTSGV